MTHVGRIIVRVAKFGYNTTQKVYNAIKPHIAKVVNAIGTVLRRVWNATKKVVQFVDHYVTLVLTKIVLALVEVLKFTTKIIKTVALFVDKVVTWVLTKTVQILYKTVKWVVTLLAKTMKTIAGKLWQLISFIADQSWEATKIIFRVLKKILTVAWNITVKTVTFLKDLLVEMANTLVEFLLRVRILLIKVGRVLGKILTFCGRLAKQWLWRPFVSVVKFIDRILTAVLEWTVQTLWKALNVLVEKLFDLTLKALRYTAIALKHLYKASMFVAEYAARLLVKVAEFVKKTLLMLGDKMFDLALQLIAYTARALRFTAFHIIKPTAIWLWNAIKVVSKLVWRFASSVWELLKSVVLTIYHVTSLIGGRLGRFIGAVARIVANLLVKFHGLIVTTIGVVAKFLLDVTFRLLYCVDWIVTKAAWIISYPLKWLLTLAATLTDYGLQGVWQLLMLTGKVINYLILVPLEKLVWATGELLTLSLNLLRECMIVGATLLINTVAWLRENFINTLDLALTFVWASIKWIGRTSVKMAQRFVQIVKISATFLLKVKRKIGAFLTAVKNAVVRMKNKIVSVSVAAWRRVVMMVNYLGNRSKAAYNKSGIPRLLAAIKTAAVILATSSKQRLVLIKNRIGAMITQMRENGKKRRERMMAFAKARIQQFSAVFAVLSGQLNQRAKAIAARVGIAMVFMKQRGIAMKNRAIMVKNGMQAKIAALTLRMQQRFMQVNQFIAFMQARMAALLKQRVGGNVKINDPPVNNNALVQPVQ